MTKTERAVEEQRWSLVRQREHADKARFIYAVKTTGVYCRPGCPSRLPLRGNVVFFEDSESAKAAGYRPCKRCTPDGPRTTDRDDAVTAACRMIEGANEPLSLQQLALAVNYSPAHFQRLFKKSVGVTPKAYAAMSRANRVRANLLENRSVTVAAYSSGYGTSSQFYDDSAEVLGMKPSEYRDRAGGIVIHVTVVPTYLGAMLVAATEKGLCGIEFGDTRDELIERFGNRFPAAQLAETDDFNGWVAKAVSLVNSPGSSAAIPFDIQGTAFQRKVWEALRSIPAGTTSTYSKLAAQLGKPRAFRAVGSACAANRLAVAIPCHRVVRRDGGMGGYRWGIERKKALLEREADSEPENH